MLPDAANSSLRGGRSGPLHMIAKASDPAPEPLEWLPFTMTAGDSGDWYGFSSGNIASPPFNPPVGSISEEPSTKFPLEALFVDSDSYGLVAIFYGSMTEEQMKISITVSGVTITESKSHYFAGTTVIEFGAGNDQFLAGQQYDISFANLEP